MKKALKKLFTLYMAALVLAGGLSEALANDVDNDSAVAGISVSINNYSAASFSPQEEILDYLSALNAEQEQKALQTEADVVRLDSVTVAAPVIPEGSSAISKGVISVVGEVNVRRDPSVDAESLGMLSSTMNVSIYDTVTNEEGSWSLVDAGILQGYVKSDYIITGNATHVVESNVNNRTATVITDTLEIKDAANDSANTVETLSYGESYEVMEVQGDYVKLRRDDYAIGYAPLDGVKITSELPGNEEMDSEQTERFKGYMQDLDFARSEYQKRMTAGDYSGAYNCATYLVEIWGYYITDAENAGLADAAAEARVERENAILQMNDAEARKAEYEAGLNLVYGDEEAPEELPAAYEELPAEAEAAEAEEYEGGMPPVEIPSQAPVVTAIEAMYRGGVKYEGEVIYSSDLYLIAKFNDGEFRTIEEGWSSPDVGMNLSAGTKVVTMYYGDYSSAFELYVNPVPTEAPAPEPAPAPAPAPVQEAAPAPAPAPAPAYPADIRAQVAGYAASWAGRCSYVWGGTNLADGGQVDCSGFTMNVYARVAGISLPHYSMAQMNAGTPISYEQLRPGDLVFYSGHVAIYIGGGAIVHAKNPSVGIVTDSVFFSPTQPPIGYRSLLP